jgi:hemolysin activation/secretion protein
VSLSYSHNLALGGARGGAADFEAVRPGAPKGFQVLRGSGFASLPVGENWLLTFRFFGQATPDRLVPGEQFGLAGVGVVRGYEEREVAGDSGMAGSFEVMMPRLLPRTFGDPAEGFGDLRLVAFADAGNVSNHDSLTCDGVRTTCTLSSLGVGARFLFGTSRWRIDLARAGNTGRFTDRGDVRVHFNAAISFP